NDESDNEEGDDFGAWEYNQQSIRMKDNSGFTWRAPLVTAAEGSMVSQIELAVTEARNDPPNVAKRYRALVQIFNHGRDSDDEY
ncbi:hypothetical protein LTR81_026050, partial [Elasticomyces elasticus]